MLFSRNWLKVDPQGTDGNYNISAFSFFFHLLQIWPVTKSKIHQNICRWILAHHMKAERNYAFGNEGSVSVIYSLFILI